MTISKFSDEVMSLAKARPSLMPFADPSTDAGAAELVEGMSDQEKLQFIEFVSISKSLTQASVRRAKSETDFKKQLGALIAVQQGASLFLAQQVSVALSSPDGRLVSKQIPCSKGCYYCCYINVEASIVEAIVIAGFLLHEKRSLATKVTRIAPLVMGLSANERIKRHVPCPLLVDKKCGIYPARPLTCQAHVSLSLPACKAAFEKRPVSDMPIFGLPKIIAASLLQGVKLACQGERVQHCNVELTAAVGLVCSDLSVVRKWLDGEEVFTAYVSNS